MSGWGGPMSPSSELTPMAKDDDKPTTWEDDWIPEERRAKREVDR
jgi:hypothetical protein